MSQTITLNVPDNFVLLLQRAAQATRQPVEQLLLRVLQSSLPPLDESLPPAMKDNLTLLEMQDDAQLWQTLKETVPPVTATRLHKLLELQQVQALSAAEQKSLAGLQQTADLVMLRKARAAVLLRFRGHRLPTLAELQQMTGPLP